MMKIAALAASLAVIAGLAAAPASAMASRPKLTGEAQLAKILDGRVAGKPVSCVQMNQTDDVTIVDKTALVYKVGATYYVNRPTNADSLNDNEILVTKTYTSELCRLDTVQLHDRTSRMWSGFVGLQDFVPYTRVKTPKS